MPKRLKGFLEDQSGSSYIILALGVAMIFGMAGLAVDMGYGYMLRQRLQTAADAAALDDHAYARILGNRIKGPMQCLDEVFGERVVLMGPIEGQRADACRILAQQHGLIGIVGKLGGGCAHSALSVGRARLAMNHPR